MKHTSTFHDIVRLRRSIRQFLPTPLTSTEMQAVLDDAQRAPSNCNTQPWIVHIVSGATRDALASALIAAAEADKFSPDFSWDENAFPEPLDTRRREQGKSYYEALGIARGDSAGRHAALLKNLNFFDAPHAAFLFMPAIGDSVRVASDMGMYAQTFLLSLAAHGFAGIPQTLLGLFSEPVRALLSVPSDMKLLFAISFGHPDMTAASRIPYMPRAELNESVTMHE